MHDTFSFADYLLMHVLIFPKFTALWCQFENHALVSPAMFPFIIAAIGRVGRSSGFTDVFCDGDELNLNCSTPYSVFHLAWDVTIPGQNPERSQITYNAGSLLNRPTHLDNGATSILYRFAESELSLPVTGGILVNGVTVECSINLLMSTSIEIQRASLEEGV